VVGVISAVALVAFVDDDHTTSGFAGGTTGATGFTLTALDAPPSQRQHW
jgi:hypothetical protein